MKKWEGSPLKKWGLSMKRNGRPPAHLSKEARALWKQLTSEYDISDAAGLAILRNALEARDRAEAARLRIDAEGMTTLDRFAIPRPHPLLSCERDARAAFLAGMRALCLDLEPLHPRPGRPAGR